MYLNVLSFNFLEVKWQLLVCEVITIGVYGLEVWSCDWKCKNLSQIIFQKEGRKWVLVLFALLTAVFCSSCGLTGLTLCCTLSWGVGQTCYWWRHLMPTLLEKLPVAFVTICWWEGGGFSSNWLSFVEKSRFSKNIVPFFDRPAWWERGTAAALSSFAQQWIQLCGIIP